MIQIKLFLLTILFALSFTVGLIAGDFSNPYDTSGFWKTVAIATIIAAGLIVGLVKFLIRIGHIKVKDIKY